MERVHIPFGVPFCQIVSNMVDVAGNEWHVYVASPLFYGQNKDERDHRQVLFGAHSDHRCAGEGLMLWDQNAPWEPRGLAGRPSANILKYKPRALTVGVVTSAEPQHTHRMRGHATNRKRSKAEDDVTGGAEDDVTGGAEVDVTMGADRLPGYSVGVRWWDNLTGRWVPLRPYISANYGAVRCASEFAQEQKVFFTFVMYDRKPQYLHALGTHLPQWMAVNVQSMIVRSSKRSVDDTTHLGYLLGKTYPMDMDSANCKQNHSTASPMQACGKTGT